MNFLNDAREWFYDQSDGTQIWLCLMGWFIFLPIGLLLTYWYFE